MDIKSSATEQRRQIAGKKKSIASRQIYLVNALVIKGVNDAFKIRRILDFVNNQKIIYPGNNAGIHIAI